MSNRKDKNGIMIVAYVIEGMVLINLAFKPQTTEYIFKYIENHL